MKSARFKILFLLLLLGGTLFTSQSLAAEEEPWTDRFLREFDGIKARLATLEEQQKEILAKEDKILEELNIVKIWVHRK